MSTQDLVNTINGTAVAEVVKVTEGETSVHIMHRVMPKRLSVWLGIVAGVLSGKQGWDAHICKQYFLAGDGLKHAWNLIARWGPEGDKEAITMQICQLITLATKQAKRIVHQLESYPLTGADANRNMPEGPLNFRASGYKQKGAHKISTKQ